MTANQQAAPDPQAWLAWRPPPGVPDAGQLDLLVADAAARAADLLAGTQTEAADPLVDAVRLLATPVGAPHAAAAARLTGVPEDELRRLVLAHRHGGAPGVAAALAATPCGAQELTTAVAQVGRRRTLAVGELAVADGSITDSGAGVRLRLGPDLRWYPFTFARDRWWPAAGANASAGLAYQAGTRARALRRTTP